MDLARHAATVEMAAARAIRAAIYLSLFLTPVLITSPDTMFGYADVPKIAAVRVFAGLIAIGWVAHAAAGVVISGKMPRVHLVFRHGWITGSAAVFLLVGVVSSIFAVSPATAFRGAYPGFDATDLYSLVAYVVTGAAAARFLRSRRHLEIAIWSIAFAAGLASVYGVVQFAGLDPLHFDRFEVNDGRSPLTFGNPAFAGSFLSISLFLTLGLFFMQDRPFSRAGLLAFSLITLQVVALGASASRGAWIGTGVGAVLFAVLALVVLRAGRDKLPVRHLALLGVPASAALIAGLALVAGGSDSSDAAERLKSFNGDLLGSGLNGRQATWTATLEMLRERTWPELEPGGGISSAFTRHVFGYGPDTYRYAYQQVAPDEHTASFVPHAHNSFLNTAAELGIAGLLAWTALSISVLVAGVKVARADTASPWMRLFAAALTAGFLAHAIDQLAGVPRASDSLAMWALIGMLVALASLTSIRSLRYAPDKHLNSESDQAERKNTVSAKNGKASGIAFAAPPVAVVLIAVLAGVTVYANAGHILADRAAASLQSRLMRGALVSELEDSSGAASGLASDVAYYHTLEASALDTAAGAAAGSGPFQRRLAEGSLAARKAAAEAIPLSPAENFSYGRALFAAGNVQAAIERFEFGVTLSPRYWAAWLELASTYAAAGMVEKGAAALEKAEELLARQTLSAQQDPLNLRNFSAVRAALGVQPG